MAFSTLISTAALAMHLDDPAFAIVDCRYKLDDESWGEREYTKRHIAGAVYAHLGHDLAGPKTGTNGRHPLPDPKTLADTFGRFGITSGVQVVAYDQDNGMYASRLWWMLRWLGHDAAAVLDGGFEKWMAEGRPMTAGAEPLTPCLALMNTALRCWALFLLRRRRRFRVLAMRLGWRVQEPPHGAFHATGDLVIR